MCSRYHIWPRELQLAFLKDRRKDEWTTDGRARTDGSLQLQGGNRNGEIFGAVLSFCHVHWGPYECTSKVLHRSTLLPSLARRVRKHPVSQTILKRNCAVRSFVGRIVTERNGRLTEPAIHPYLPRYSSGAGEYSIAICSRHNCPFQFSFPTERSSCRGR